MYCGTRVMWKAPYSLAHAHDDNRMVAEGALSARISQREQMVRFDQATGGSTAPAAAELVELESLLQELVALDAKVGEVDHSVRGPSSHLPRKRRDCFAQVSCDMSYLSKVAVGTRRIASFEEVDSTAT